MTDEIKWIPWAGGECPVDPYARVYRMLRDGSHDASDGADEAWQAGRYDWSDEQCDGDIIAYCIVDEPKADEPKSPSGHTLDDDFAHFLAYSNLSGESDDVKAKLRLAYAANWPREVSLTSEHRQVIEESAQVLESAAAHNRSKGRTVMWQTQQGRATRLREILDATNGSDEQKGDV